LEVTPCLSKLCGTKLNLLFPPAKCSQEAQFRNPNPSILKMTPLSILAPSDIAQDCFLKVMMVSYKNVLVIYNGGGAFLANY
jgi:hypothetical protein